MVAALSRICLIPSVAGMVPWNEQIRSHGFLRKELVGAPVSEAAITAAPAETEKGKRIDTRAIAKSDEGMAHRFDCDAFRVPGFLHHEW
jgi:hypothetical protein